MSDDHPPSLRPEDDVLHHIIAAAPTADIDLDAPHDEEPSFEEEENAQNPPPPPSSPPGPLAMEKIVLKGVFANPTWTGEWGFEKDFEAGDPGKLSKFEYKRMPKKVPLFEPQSAGNPPDMFLSGFFMLKTMVMGSSVKVDETDVLMRFTRTDEDELFEVRGAGKNKFGVFELTGTFDSSTEFLEVVRAYQAKDSAVPKKPMLHYIASPRPDLGGTPRQTPRVNAGVHAGVVQPTTWEGPSASGASAISSSAGGARARRKKSYAAEEAIGNPDLNRKNTMRMDQVVKKLLAEDSNLFFHAPVDPVAMGLLNYFDKISSPMDLGTVRSKLVNGRYESEADVEDDIRLTFDNAMHYNPRGSICHEAARRLVKALDSEIEKLHMRSGKSSSSKSKQSDHVKKRKSYGGDGASSPPQSKYQRASSYGDGFEDEDDEDSGDGRHHAASHHHHQRKSRKNFDPLFDSGDDDDDVASDASLTYEVRPTKTRGVGRRAPSSSSLGSSSGVTSRYSAQPPPAAAAGPTPLEEIRALHARLAMLESQLGGGGMQQQHVYQVPPQYLTYQTLPQQHMYQASPQIHTYHAPSPLAAPPPVQRPKPAPAPKPKPAAPAPRPVPPPRQAPTPARAPPAATFDDDEESFSMTVPRAEPELSYQEKRQLGQDINKLPEDKVARVIEIIQEFGDQMNGDNPEEVEIDFEKLNNGTLKALQKYVRDVLKGEKKKASSMGL